MIFIIPFIPFIYILILLFFLYKRKSVKYDIQWGRICWNCKGELDEVSPIFNKDKGLNKELKCCKPCDRDLKIIQISSTSISFLIKIKRLIISDEFKKILKALIFINLFMLILFIFSIILSNYFKQLLILNTLFNVSFWILLISEQYFTTIKKPSNVS